MESYNPQPHTRDLILNVDAILDENRDILPLTLRQIFYMLVSGYGYDKTERDYQNLIEVMNKARRSQMIPMDAIRDDGLGREDVFSWDSEWHLINSFKGWARNFRLDRQRDQDQRIFVWCEARGMMPQLAKYCKDWGVSVLSSGGFDSVTTKHDLAQEFSDERHVVVLHIGDHDPSGVHMHKNLDEDLSAFLEHFGGSLEVERLAVVPWQVEELKLPTAPPKRTDNRSFTGLTTQAEAIPPKTLREIVEMELEERIDPDIRQGVLDEEEAIRQSLSERLEDL